MFHFNIPLQVEQLLKTMNTNPKMGKQTALLTKQKITRSKRARHNRVQLKNHTSTEVTESVHFGASQPNEAGAHGCRLCTNDLRYYFALVSVLLTTKL